MPSPQNIQPHDLVVFLQDLSRHIATLNSDPREAVNIRYLVVVPYGTTELGVPALLSGRAPKLYVCCCGASPISKLDFRFTRVNLYLFLSVATKMICRSTALPVRHQDYLARYRG